MYHAMPCAMVYYITLPKTNKPFFQKLKKLDFILYFHHQRGRIFGPMFISTCPDFTSGTCDRIYDMLFEALYIRKLSFPKDEKCLNEKTISKFLEETAHDKSKLRKHVNTESLSLLL